MTAIWINEADIEKIKKVLEQFPGVKRFQLEEYGHSGIGSCLDMIFDAEVNGVKCKLSVPIADESSW